MNDIYIFTLNDSGTWVSLLEQWLHLEETSLFYFCSSLGQNKNFFRVRPSCLCHAGLLLLIFSTWQSNNGLWWTECMCVSWWVSGSSEGNGHDSLITAPTAQSNLKATLDDHEFLCLILSLFSCSFYLVLGKLEHKFIVLLFTNFKLP